MLDGAGQKLAIRELTSRLIGERSRPLRLEPPASPGVYALFLTELQNVGGVPAGTQGILYVGTSENLSERHASAHFNSKNTGFSTLRRTLGALLRTELNLTPAPRGKKPTKSNKASYRFTPEGEERLTDWMVANLVASHVCVDEPGKIEKDLIRLLEPPLNLTGWDNPHRSFVRRKRQECQLEALSS